MDRRKKTRSSKRKRQIFRNRLFLSIFLVFLILIIKNAFSLGGRIEKASENLDLIGTAKDYSEKIDSTEERLQQKIEYDEANTVEGYIKNIEKAAKVDKNAKLVLDNKDELPESMIKMAGRNPDTIDFIAKYIDNRIDYTYIYPNKIYKDLNYPYYIQWDQNWGYQEYGSGIIGDTGCAPTSIAMMLSGITNRRITPSDIAKLSHDNGYVGDYGTNWDVYPFIANEYDLELKDLPNSKNKITEALDDGYSIIVSVGPGTFTTVSHVMLIVDYDNQGRFLIYDPNNLNNSEKAWNFDEFSQDIKKMWAFKRWQSWRNIEKILNIHMCLDLSQLWNLLTAGEK